MKEAYYFSHDSNARHDPKILAMRSVYGVKGYGMYWIIIEMLREQEQYKLQKSKYLFNAIAMQMQSTEICKDDAQEFVSDCINEFDLLAEDEQFIWSNSLLKRMEMKDDLSEKRRKAAKARWDKASNDADSKQVESKDDANAMQMDSNSNAIKEKKVKEKKVNKKIKYADSVSMSEEEYQKLLDQFGEQGTKERIENLNLYKGSTGKTYKNDYLTLLNWERKNKQTTPKNDFDNLLNTL